MSKSGLPTPIPQFVTLQVTLAEAQALHHLAAEALKYGQFTEPGFNLAEGQATFSALKKLHVKIMRYVHHPGGK